MEQKLIKVSDVVYREDLYPRVKPEDEILVEALKFIDGLNLSVDIISDLVPMKPSLDEKKYRDAVLSFFGNKCFVCGYRSFVDVHHVQHKAKQGSDRIDNLIVLCPNHHKEWHYIENTFFIGVGDMRSADKRTNRTMQMDWFIPDFVMRNNISPFFIQLKTLSEASNQ